MELSEAKDLRRFIKEQSILAEDYLVVLVNYIAHLVKQVALTVNFSPLLIH